MIVPRPVYSVLVVILGLLGINSAALAAEPARSPAAHPTERELLARLDAPLLFVKRHSYTGIHIYDTYYKWPPGRRRHLRLGKPRRSPRPVEDPASY